MNNILTTLTLGLVISLAALPSRATTTTDLQRDWAIANYQTEAATKADTFDRLIIQAEAALANQPNNAELLIWTAIIKSTSAGVKGGLSALSLVNAAKAHLEDAMEIDDMALQGSVYTSLGALYYQVPGWPVGFGSDKKAQKMLDKAVTINPDGLDSNYFYGDFLVQQKKYDAARERLNKAMAATVRPGRELAEAGRRAEIVALLETIKDK
ncbi:MAG: tetratricopeptide (TPR) repeat protein [Candidatus Azotimanducaceae bacterium]|jgi:tetratricopeptide (TPR) repeat protein